jgi:Fic family protein
VRIPQRPPETVESLRALLAKKDVAARMIGSGAYSATVGDRYVHWDNLRFRSPPGGVTPQDWWGLIKLARRSLYKPLPLHDSRRREFQFAMPDPLQRMLSEADRDLSGRVAIPEQLSDPGTRDRFIFSALIEEAITSSQLEGASTTRKVAAEMLRSGRKPRDKSERMIFNNFEAMRFMRTAATTPLSPDLVLEIHRRVTDGTLDDPADAGRLRTSDDIRVFSPEGDELHRPPPARELPGRLRDLCRLANGETPSYFLHPVVRAVLLHFGLACDHPFVDGNGRTARAVFYWSMLKSNYWLSEYVSISSILRKASARYSRSFLYSETDDNDATYFILYQMEVLLRAIRALHDFVRKKVLTLRQIQGVLKQAQYFNHRQLALLGHALGHPDAHYTPTSHANSHQVTRQTARTDLKELADLHLLGPVRAGNGFAYFPLPDLDRRLEEFGRKRRAHA